MREVFSGVFDSPFRAPFERKRGSSAAMSANFLSGPLDPRITFTRASTASYFDSAGVLRSAAVDTPRLDYDPVTLQPKGLLIEGARTNLLLQSGDMTAAAWVANDATVVADGTISGLPAHKVSDNSATLYGQLTQNLSGLPIGSYTLQTKVKKRTGATSLASIRLHIHDGTTTLFAGIHLNANTGVLDDRYGPWNARRTGYGVVDCGDCWLVWVSATLVAGDSLIAYKLFPAHVTTNAVSGASLVGDHTFAGTQLEAGGVASSYIPTTAGPVTRAADSALMAGTNFSSWYNPHEGTFVIEASYINATAAGRRAYSADDGTANNQIRGIEGVQVIAGGVTQADIANTALTDRQIFKSAGAYRLNDFAASVNGGAVVTDVSGTVPTVDRLLLGAGSTFQATAIHIRRLDYYRTRLSNADLQRLTA